MCITGRGEASVAVSGKVDTKIFVVRLWKWQGGGLGTIKILTCLWFAIRRPKRTFCPNDNP
jgi:hypothetical protein